MIIVFRSRLRPDHIQEYERMAPRIEALARSMPGFISIDAFAATDGERVSIVEFESEESLAAWRDHPEHRTAQDLGRKRFYSEYSIEVCERKRASRFVHSADSTPEDAR